MVYLNYYDFQFLKKNIESLFPMQMLFFLHSEEICMTKLVVATPLIIFFIFEYQKLVFWTSVVIQVKKSLFPKFLTDSYIFQTFAKIFVSEAARFISFLRLHYFFKFSLFFVTASPTDSMKLLWTQDDWDFALKFLGSRKEYPTVILSR